MLLVGLNLSLSQPSLSQVTIHLKAAWKWKHLRVEESRAHCLPPAACKVWAAACDDQNFASHLLKPSDSFHPWLESLIDLRDKQLSEGGEGKAQHLAPVACSELSCLPQVPSQPQRAHCERRGTTRLQALQTWRAWKGDTSTSPYDGPIQRRKADGQQWTEWKASTATEPRLAATCFWQLPAVQLPELAFQRENEESHPYPLALWFKN